ATIKKELATMSLALDLPKDHGLRVTIAQYKQRFEDYSDELKSMHTPENLSSLKEELAESVNSYRMVKAQCKAVLSELKKQTA
ncbi:unnamed protein product, partial [Cladocopium goreaui]